MAPVRGHTLAELLVVLVVLGSVAALAMPQSEPANGLRLDAAAKDVAQALRFAQGAAQRTGAMHLVRCDLAGGSIGVTRGDAGAGVVATELTTPVSHPVDRKDYKIVFSAVSSLRGVSISSCAFSFTGTPGTVAQVAFAADGAPVNVLGAKAPDVKPLSGTGQIVLASGPARRTVLVSAPSGRVTIAP